MSNASDRGAGHVRPAFRRGLASLCGEGAGGEDNSPGPSASRTQGDYVSRRRTGTRGGLCLQDQTGVSNMFGADGKDPIPVNNTHNVDNANHSIFLICISTTSPCVQ